MKEQTASHYKVLEKIGEGAMGVVYKAQDTRLERVVALKFLREHLWSDPIAKARFIHEAKGASAINHQNITTIYDIGEVEGKSYIAMEYLEGKSVKELAKESLKLNRVLEIGVQIAEGLAAAHKKEIVHRDIKSENIMLTKNQVVKIMDFGVAKLKGATVLTDSGTAVGTFAYMSPEQARGEEIDHRSDLFSLGVVLYELITGRLPFQGASKEAISYSLWFEEPEPLVRYKSGAPEELQRIVSKVLRKDWNIRYQSAEDLLADLRQLQREMAGGGVELGQPRIMIAVLPFENLGPAQDEYFADGITDEITTNLVKVRGFGVVSRTTAMQYKRTERKLKQIGNELGVDYVLEGTVRWDKSGEYNQLRINSQLIRVRDDTYLWAESYDRDLSQVFEVQRSIAIEVTEALFTALITSSPWIYIEPPGTHSLQATGTPSRPAVSEKTDPRQEEYKSPQGGFAGKVAFPGESRPTTSLEAYDYYLRGNDYFKRAFAERDLRIAVEMYDKSVRLDPKFVQAYAMLSRAHLGLYWMWYYVESDERLIKARQAVNEALRLNPNLPEVHLALGYYYYWGEQNYDRALKQFTTALELQPNNSDILAAIGTVQGRRGKFEEAIYNLTRASGFDSRNAHKAYVAGMTYLLMRKYKEAERYLNRAISLSPEWPMPYLQKARLYLSMEGDKEKGLEVFKEGFSKIDLAGLVTQASPVDLKVVFGILDAEYLEVLERIPAESFGADRSGYFLFRALLSDRMGRPELRKANHDTARAVLEERVKVRPREPYLHSYLGIAYADLGRKEEAVCEGTKAVELLPALEDAVDGPNWSENLAQIEVMVGEFEAAIDQLEYLLSVPTFFISVPYIRLDPTWAPLRNHRRFQKLVAGK